MFLVGPRPRIRPGLSRAGVDTHDRATPPGLPQSHGNRNLLLIVIAFFVIAAIAAGGYGLWYILIGPAAPGAVSGQAPVIPTGASVPAPASLDGSWQVDTSLGSMDDFSASWTGYRVQEQLVGIGGNTAVGRTPKVTGSMTLTGSTVSDVQMTADLTALASDDPNRDAQLQSQAINTDAFPTATFKTTQPVDLGTLPAEGKTISCHRDRSSDHPRYDQDGPGRHPGPTTGRHHRCGRFGAGRLRRLRLQGPQFILGPVR